MDTRIDDSDWEHIFENYTCPTHVRRRQVMPVAGNDTGGYRRADVATVIAIEDGANDEAEWVGVFLMTDGKYLVVRAGCDYTGWGCQEGGSSDVADDLADAVALGLTEGERARLASQLPRTEEKK